MEKQTIVKIIAAVVLLGVIGAIAAFYPGDVINASGSGTAQSAASDAPVKEFAIESSTTVIDGKYYPKFSPTEITVKKGDKVRLKITVTSGMHDFKLDEFNVYADTPLNKETVVEFVADKTGEFTYYCSKPGHRQAGQWGTLKVVG